VIRTVANCTWWKAILPVAAKQGNRQKPPGDTTIKGQNLNVEKQMEHKNL
jgi:hypothetical protein